MAQVINHNLTHYNLSGGQGGGDSSTIKGYFHEGGFYKDSAFTEPIEGSTEAIYLDVTDGKLYRYDAASDVFVQNGDGSGVELGDETNGLNLDTDGKLNLALASGSSVRSILVTGGEWDGLVFTCTNQERIAVEYGLVQQFYLYRFSEDTTGQGRSFPNAALACYVLIAEGASGVAIGINTSNWRLDLSTSTAISETTYNGTLSDCGITLQSNGAMSVADKVKLDGLPTGAELDEVLSEKLDDAPSDGKQYARKDGDWEELDEVLAGKESANNKVTSISASSTDDEYPSAKCVYDIIGNVESAISTINQTLGAI